MNEIGLHSAGMAALTICQNLLLRLMELGVIDAADVRGILEASADMHDDAADDRGLVEGEGLACALEPDGHDERDERDERIDPNTETAWLIRAVIDSMSEVLGPMEARPH